MAKSIIKLSAVIIIIALLTYLAVCGFSFTDTKKIHGIMSEDGVTQGLDLNGGSVIVFKAEKENPSSEEMDTVAALLQTRLDGMGYTEADISVQGEDSVRVEIPSFSNPEEAAESLGATAQLKFYDNSGLDMTTGMPIEGAEVLSGEHIKDASSQYGATSEMGAAGYYVQLELTTEGQQAFYAATAANVGQPIYIVMDNTVISAPVVNEAINDTTCIISGDFTQEEAKNLAANIKSGQLPFSLSVTEMRAVNATLGADALKKAVTAGIIGLILVMLFMIIFYRLPGFMSAIALVAYVDVVLLLLANLHINLTLAGIAGIILAVGMAVDANVIIFERIKEELVNGKGIRTSVEAGFHRALGAVIDSNITTIIAAIILMILGSGTIKGFGTTLLIGVIISMLSAIFVTRFLLRRILEMGVSNIWLYGVSKKKLAKKEGQADA